MTFQLAQLSATCTRPSLQFLNHVVKAVVQENFQT
jgi:hypothetical protein